MLSGWTVAVVRGGSANEREVSLRSGAEVFAALERQGVAVLDWNITQIADVIALAGQAPRPLMVFNMVHGRGGEDGQLQALLDTLNLPYTGSKMLASALAMDKILTKRLWRDLGLPTAQDWVVTAQNLTELAINALPYPVMVKPSREGSSIGICKVDQADHLVSAIETALQYDREVLVEQWIDGLELTVAVLNGQALPIIRLQTPNAFYDYDAKYRADNTEYLCPAGLSDRQEADLRHLAERAFAGVGAEGWGRVDIMLDHHGKAYLLEVNTVPGMTDHSLMPMAAKAAGMSFDDLVMRILSSSLLSFLSSSLPSRLTH
jgi:D-alanine-D-alanine ligase